MNKTRRMVKLKTFYILCAISVAILLLLDTPLSDTFRRVLLQQRQQVRLQQIIATTQERQPRQLQLHHRHLEKQEQHLQQQQERETPGDSTQNHERQTNQRVEKNKMKQKVFSHKTSRAKSSTSTSAKNNRKSRSTTTTTSFVASKGLRTALRWTELDRKRKPGDPFWQWVDREFGVLVYSAHFDDVQLPPLVRLVGLARYPLPYRNVTCLFHHARCYRGICPVVLATSGEVYHHRRANGRNYLGAFVDCPLDGLPRGVLPYAVTVRRAKDSAGNSSFAEIHYSGSEDSALASLSIINTSRTLSNNANNNNDNPNDSFVNKDRSKADATDNNNHTSAETSNDRSGSSNTDSKDRNNDSSDKKNASTAHGAPGAELRNEYRWNITRCTPALHGRFDNHLMLAEMVSASRAVGVDHFAFYVESASPSVTNTLQVLETQGLGTVFPWNLRMGRRDLFYTGQFSAIQDCLYSYVYKHLRSSKYLVFGDVDELFMPFPTDSLVPLLDRWFKQMPTCGSFAFLNTFVDIKSNRSLSPAAVNRKDTNSSFEQHVLSLAEKHGLTMLLHNVRARKPLPSGQRSKTALDPRRVERGSVHVVDKMRPGSRPCVMKPDQGLLFHYRELNSFTNDTVVDDALWSRFARPVLKGTLSILEAADKLGQRRR